MIVNEIDMCTLKLRLNRNAHTWIKIHICTFYLIFITENNPACSHYRQELIHIFTYFLSLHIPQHRHHCDKPVLSCCHIFVQVAHFRCAFIGFVESFSLKMMDSATTTWRNKDNKAPLPHLFFIFFHSRYKSHLELLKSNHSRSPPSQIHTLHNRTSPPFQPTVEPNYCRKQRLTLGNMWGMGQ